jgi:hypothetical protein
MIAAAVYDRRFPRRAFILQPSSFILHPSSFILKFVPALARKPDYSGTFSNRRLKRNDLVNR